MKKFLIFLVNVSCCVCARQARSVGRVFISRKILYCRCRINIIINIIIIVIVIGWLYIWKNYLLFGFSVFHTTTLKSLCWFWIGCCSFTNKPTTTIIIKKNTTRNKTYAFSIVKCESRKNHRCMFYSYSLLFTIFFIGYYAFRLIRLLNIFIFYFNKKMSLSLSNFLLQKIPYSLVWSNNNSESKIQMNFERMTLTMRIIQFSVSKKF